MMKKRLIILLLFTIVFTLTNCKKQESFDFGKLENGLYTNNFFKFSIAIPEKWVVQNDEQKKKISESGKDLIAGDNKNLKNAMTAAEVNSAQLITVFKHEVGAAVKYNPSISVMAENLKGSPGIKTGKDYLFHVKRFLSQSQAKYIFHNEEFELEKIGNFDFYRMNTSMIYLGFEIKQIYYSTIINGFTLGIIISYGDEKQKEELLGILKTFKSIP